MNVAIYVRVSTEEQAREGFSIAAQRERLKMFCDSQGWNITKEYIEEGRSAKNTERPELQTMLKELDKFDMVLVYKLDRLTRSVIDLYSLLKIFDENNVSFRSATEVFDTSTALGRLFITLVGAIAQWERETIAERVRLGMEQKVDEGKKPGGVAPYGYTYDGETLHINEKEAKVVRRIFDLYASGLGVYAIQNRLEQEGYRTRSNGKRFAHSLIRLILAHPVYIGKIKWADKLTDGHHEHIVSEELFYKVQAVRKSKHNGDRKSYIGKYPLTGVLKCGACGTSMSGKIHHKGTNYERVYYRCYNSTRKTNCEMPMVRGKELEEAIVNELDRLFKNEKELDDMIKKNAVSNEDEPNKSDLEKELSKISKQKNKWYELFTEGLPKEDLLKNIKPLLEREEELQTEISMLEEYTEHLSAEEIIQSYSNFKEKWNKSTTDDKKIMINSLFESITLHLDNTVDFKFK